MCFPLLRKILLRISIIACLIAPAIAYSADFSFNLDEGTSLTSRMVQVIALITVLSLAPSILVMVTSFTRIVVVLSFLRSALGLQQTPPNTVLISLALFLTFFIMAPTFEQAYHNGVVPLMEEKITEKEAFPKMVKPFHSFMARYVRDKDLELFLTIAKQPTTMKREEVPLHVLTPSFMISELHRAFEIGFLIFIPFLIIDMLVSSILMAMGMMMLPPVMISLPFKLIFFVVVDGWYLVCGSLVKSFS
jgi:flagellar biosynthetic protein FliP